VEDRHVHWQDWALTGAALIYIFALIPTVLSRIYKPALTTSVLNAAVSAGIAAVYVTLSLWFASATTAANAALWLIIAIQSYAIRRRRASP
jgi:hypothetical protein